MPLPLPVAFSVLTADAARLEGPQDQKLGFAQSDDGARLCMRCDAVGISESSR